MLALIIAHFGNRIHRASWFGGLVIYQAIASLALLVPEFYQPLSDVVQHDNGQYKTIFFIIINAIVILVIFSIILIKDAWPVRKVDPN